MTADAGRWRQLGHELIQRRTALDPRYHNRGAFSEATGLSYRLVYDVEEARRTNFGVSTLAAIESAYRLEPGSVQRFLKGGDLETAAPSITPPATPPGTFLGIGGQAVEFPPMTPEMEALVMPEVTSVLLDIESARADEIVQAAAEDREPRPLPGRAIFADADEARIYDSYQARQYGANGIALIIAYRRVRAAERRQRGNGAASSGLGPVAACIVPRYAVR